RLTARLATQARSLANTRGKSRLACPPPTMSRRFCRMSWAPTDPSDSQCGLLAKPDENAAQLPEFVIHFMRGAYRLHHLLPHGAGELPAQPVDMRFDRAHRQAHSLRSILI